MRYVIVAFLAWLLLATSSGMATLARVAQLHPVARDLSSIIDNAHK